MTRRWGAEGKLRPLLGLAWDCGAVTTGPVTVPVLIALGIGPPFSPPHTHLAAS